MEEAGLMGFSGGLAQGKLETALLERPEIYQYIPIWSILNHTV